MSNLMAAIQGAVNSGCTVTFGFNLHVEVSRSEISARGYPVIPLNVNFEEKDRVLANSVIKAHMDLSDIISRTKGNRGSIYDYP